MKIDVSKPLKNLAGLHLKDVDGDMTLKVACVAALMGQYEGENLDGQEKFKRYELAKKIYAGGEVELSVEEIAKIKPLIAKGFGPVVVGPAYDILEGKE